MLYILIHDRSRFENITVTCEPPVDEYLLEVKHCVKHLVFRSQLIFTMIQGANRFHAPVTYEQAEAHRS